MINYKMVRFANKRLNGAQYKVFTELYFGWDYVCSNAIRTDYTHSVSQIATATNQSEKTVRTAIKDLEGMGWLHVKRQRKSEKLNETNSYSINVATITALMVGIPEGMVKSTEIKTNNNNNDMVVNSTDGGCMTNNTPNYDKRKVCFNNINNTLRQMKACKSEPEWNELNNALQMEIENARPTYRKEPEFETFKDKNTKAAAVIRKKIEPTWEKTTPNINSATNNGDVPNTPTVHDANVETGDDLAPWEEPMTHIYNNGNVRHSPTFHDIKDEIEQRIVRANLNGTPTLCIVPNLIDDLANNGKLSVQERKELEEYVYNQAC